MDDELNWFAVRGHWVIRKVVGTKDKYYVACGHPPEHIKRIYGICRCGKDHSNDQPFDMEKASVEAAGAMAKEIDKQVLESLIKK